MAKLSAKQHKENLDSALSANITYKSLGGNNPYRILLDGGYYFVYIRNLSFSFLKSSKDVWRAQLPNDDQFAEMKESPIPFIFLGYDSDNDVYATWNPFKVKQRLNEVAYASFYSRLSAQKESRKENKFVRVELHNSGDVLIFPREKLSSYLVNYDTYFPDTTDYVAMGSKRRTEANEAYRELNNTKNIQAFAKYLEDKNCSSISDYCKVIKALINSNLFSKYRRDFLAADSIYQYDSAVDRFMSNEEIQTFETDLNANLKDILYSYISFLKQKFEQIDDNDEGDDFAEDNNSDVSEPISDTTAIDWDTPNYVNGYITKIANPEVLHLIEPYLNTEYRKPLPAVNIVKDFYKERFDVSKMEFKDWMKIIQNIDWETCYNAPTPQKASKKKTHFLRVTFSDGRILQHRNSARTFALVIEECYPDLIQEMGIIYYGINLVSNAPSEKYGSSQIPICDGRYYVMTNYSTPLKKDILDKINSELGLDYKTELIPIEQFQESDSFISDMPSAPRKRIRVTFPNGRIVQNTQVQQTLVDVIEFADPEKVMQLNVKMGKKSILTDNSSKVTGHTKYKSVGKGYYVDTNSSTQDKYKQIKQISDSLNLGLIVELI